MATSVLSLLATCGLAIAAAPAAAQPAAPMAQGVSTAVNSRALELAKLTAPLELLVEGQMRVFHQALLAGFRSEPDAVKLEADYPGIADAIWIAVAPEVERSWRADIPAYWNRVANAYAVRLNAREIEALHNFYSSPVGQEAVRGMYRNFDATPVIDEMISSDVAQISSGQFRAAARNAAEKTVETMAAEDLRAAEVLLRVIPREKIQSVKTEMQRLALEESNRVDPDFDLRIEVIMKEAIERYKKDRPLGS